MSHSLTGFDQLTDAEQYFEFFDMPYDPTLVNVNRLHILKKFSNTIKSLAASQPDLSEDERWEQYRQALQDSYAVFETSNSIEQKLFKVFNDPQPGIVKLSDIGMT
jgi:nitrogenase-stabilizing/protective protein